MTDIKGHDRINAVTLSCGPSQQNGGKKGTNNNYYYKHRHAFHAINCAGYGGRCQPVIIINRQPYPSSAGVNRSKTFKKDIP